MDRPGGPAERYVFSDDSGDTVGESIAKESLILLPPLGVVRYSGDFDCELSIRIKPGLYSRHIDVVRREADLPFKVT